MRWDRRGQPFGFQLRRSCGQPRAHPLVAGPQLLPPLPTDAHLQGLLASALHQPGRDQQEPASPARALHMPPRFEQPQKQMPQVVKQEPQPGRQRGGVAFPATESLQPPLVFEFVEHVFHVRPLPVELNDLPGVGFPHRQIRDIRLELMLRFIPESAPHLFAHFPQTTPPHHDPPDRTPVGPPDSIGVL